VNLELSISPEGNLLLRKDTEVLGGSSDSSVRAVLAAFQKGQAPGLFALAAAKGSFEQSASAGFFRTFSTVYLSGLCKIQSLENQQNGYLLEAPHSELERLILAAPPMSGAEYLNLDCLLKLWQDLDSWVQKDVAAQETNLADWLKAKAPLWHQVGRVCFHLAENKRDPDYPFAFMATYAPGLSSGGKVQYQPLSQALKEYAGEGNKDALISLLTPVQLAAEKSALVRQMVESKEIYHALRRTPEEAYALLKEVPLLEESGVLVRMPDWWQHRQKPRVTVTIGEKRKNTLGLDAMLDFQIALSLGEDKLTEGELKQILASSGDGLFFLKGQWVEINRDKLAEALKKWKEIEREAEDGLSFIESMRLLAGAPSDLSAVKQAESEDSDSVFVNAGDWLSQVLKELKSPGGTGKPEVLSKQFQGELRPYQKTGHDWLHFLTQLGLGACLADDMGLGKTVQILALLLSLKETGKTKKPSLLILPASLLTNWQAEAARFAPTLKAIYLHPSQTTEHELSALADNPQEHLNERLKNTDIVFTTYGMLLRQKWLFEVDWRLVILDEAQAIKNPDSKQTKAVKKLKAEARIALTGTPVENRLSDLWSLFDFLLPGLLGSAQKFKNFVKALNEQESRNYAPLRNLITPYILRRLKSDKSIIQDLPDKSEVKVYCGLSKQQAAVYAGCVKELKETLETVDGMKRRGLVLSYLMRFKQICNHPSQLLGNGLYKPSDSGKFERLQAIAEEVASRQEKMLIFTQFRELTDPLADFLQKHFGTPGLVLHGGTAVAKRKQLVDAFQQTDGPPYMVLTVKAGGTGLNLTRASHVVHFDRWWNPAVENQATDRAYRIGQHKNVLVHKFICPGTIEEKIDKLISEKTELADELLKGGAESILTEMSNEELLNIVSLDLDRITIGEVS